MGAQCTKSSFDGATTGVGPQDAADDSQKTVDPDSAPAVITRSVEAANHEETWGPPLTIGAWTAPAGDRATDLRQRPHSRKMEEELGIGLHPRDARRFQFFRGSISTLNSTMRCMRVAVLAKAMYGASRSLSSALSSALLLGAEAARLRHAESDVIDSSSAALRPQPQVSAQMELLAHDTPLLARLTAAIEAWDGNGAIK
jgi:hypothetical protein